MIGPGKYDAEARELMQKTNAKAVMIFIVGGVEGNGISQKSEWDAAVMLPDMLRMVADAMDRDLNVLRPLMGENDEPPRHGGAEA